MATTHIGPISEQQINTSYHVGDGGFATIQGAVNYVRANGGVGNVVIDHGYPYTEDIATITGGLYSIPIIDQRDGNYIVYKWDATATAYVPSEFAQYNSFVCQGKVYAPEGALPGSILMGFDPDGDDGKGTGNIVITANDGNDAALRIQGDMKIATNCEGAFTVDPGQGGLAFTWNLRDGAGESDFINNRGLGGGGFAWYNVPPNTPLTSSSPWAMVLDSNSSLTVAGGFRVQGDATFDGVVMLAADPVDPMEAATKQYVDTHGGGGGGGDMVYPAAGVPQSTGTAWGTSIPAANLARTNVANTFTGTQTVNGDVDATGQLQIGGAASVIGNASFGATVTLHADPTTNLQAATKQYVDAHSSMVYPGAGIALSTGSGWGLSINPATLATYPAAGVPVSTGTAWGAPIDPATLARTNAPNTFTGNQSVTGNITASGNLQGQGFLATVLASATSPLGFSVIRSSSTDTNFGGTAIDPPGTQGGLFFNTQRGSFGTFFGNGNGNTLTTFTQSAGTSFYDGATETVIASIDRSGNAHFNGTVTAGTKSFRILYPITKDSTDPEKTLTHSCLEGPEIGVYYRGEVETSNGVALVTLPEYFEALTMDDNRSVLLTQMYDEDEAEPAFAMLMSSQVRGGQFTIRSSTPTAKVAWEVKAIRADVPPLTVVGDTPPPANPEQPNPADLREPPTSEANHPPNSGYEGRTTRARRKA